MILYGGLEIDESHGPSFVQSFHSCEDISTEMSTKMFIALHGYSLRRLARLDKKNDERLTAYYIDFMAMCRRVCGQATEDDAGRGLYMYCIIMAC